MTDYFSLEMDIHSINTASNLALAHLGDAVFELLIRTWLLVHGKATSRDLHAAAVTYVSAPAQAQAANRIMPFLDSGEKAVFRRGRNAKMHSAPGRASSAEYHMATGLETLFGYLYLKGSRHRINHLFAISMEGGEETNGL